MDQTNYAAVNAQTIDKWIAGGWEWGIPISHADYVEAQEGKRGIFLTPTKTVPAEWFAPFLKEGRLRGVKVLGLASGGGQQMPVLAALGASCSVLDYSTRQLESERLVAQREGYAINIVKADMAKRLPFDDASFDLIVHPVSNCYVEDVYHVWNECFRVLKKGGVLLAGMSNGIDYLFDDVKPGEPLVVVNKLPYNPLKNEDQYKKSAAIDGSFQFSHTLEEQIGGQLKAGFRLTDLYEDRDRSGGISEYCPQYIATRAVKQP
jgi:SAM-dependent methyltransferase